MSGHIAQGSDYDQGDKQTTSVALAIMAMVVILFIWPLTKGAALDKMAVGMGANEIQR